MKITSLNKKTVGTFGDFNDVEFINKKEMKQGVVYRLIGVYGTINPRYNKKQTVYVIEDADGKINRVSDIDNNSEIILNDEEMIAEIKSGKVGISARHYKSNDKNCVGLVFGEYDAQPKPQNTPNQNDANEYIF